MSCGTLGKYVSPYISDPYALAQAQLECDGLCSVNGSSGVVGYAVVGCMTVGLIPANFPVNI